VLRDEKILLVKRKNSPAKGQWAIPGGKIKPGERLKKAAEREIFEETGLLVKAGKPVFYFDVIERDENGDLLFHYVIVDILAEYISGEIEAMDDALEAGWFSREEIPLLSLNDMSRILLKEIFNFY